MEFAPPSSCSTVLCALLSPRDEQLGGDPADLLEALGKCQAAVERILEGADARSLEGSGNELVVEFGDPVDAVTCALQMQDLVDKQNAKANPEDHIVLGVGIHHEIAEEPDPTWQETTGQRVASALRSKTHGADGIFISAAVHAKVRGKRGVGLRHFGSQDVEGEDEPVRVYQAFPGGSAGDWFGSVTEVLSQGNNRAAPIFVLVTLGLVALVVSQFELDGIEIPDYTEPSLPTSIAILPFSGDGVRAGGELYRDMIPSQLIDALGRFDGLRVADRTASLELQAEEETAAAAGQRLDVEGVITGFASKSGNWLLARAAIVRIEDGEELWTGAYYRRTSESDLIVKEMVRGMADALGLDAEDLTGPTPPVGAGGVTAGQAELGQMKSDLEDALKNVQNLNLEDSEKVTSLNNLASLYYDSGRDEESIPLYLEVISVKEKELGSDHPELAVSLNNLASVYVSMGQFDQAEPLYQRSLAIRQATLGERHPRVGNALSNLASLYHRQGRLEEAEILYERALKIRERELQLEPSDVIAELNDKAAAAQLVGNYGEAQKYYQEALDTEYSASGREHPRTATATRNLAVVRGLSGDVAESESLFDLSIGLFTKSFGSDHEEVGRTKAKLGELNRRNGRYQAAQKYHEESLETFERGVGMESPEVSSALGYLVAVFEVQGLDEEAASARKRQLEIRDSYLGPVFSYVAVRTAQHGVIRDRVQDDLSAPRLLHEYMVTVDQEGLGPEKRRFADNLHNMGLLYLDQGRFSQAEDYNLRALKMRQELYGRNHPDVALSLHVLGRVYTFQGRFIEAEQRLKESLQIFEVTLGLVHPHVARCWESLAEMSRQSNRRGDAQYAQNRADQIRTALVDANPAEASPIPD